MANDSIIIKKKKVVGHAAHHGGSWKVAYADFVTAMMAFFMVLWIMGLSDETKASIQGYFNDPAGFMKNAPHTTVVIPLDGKSRNESMKAPRSQGQGMGDAKGSDPNATKDTAFVEGEIKEKMYKIDEKKHVIVSETSEGIQIEFLEDVTSVFFESGSAVISPIGRKIIREIVPIVKDTGRFMVFEGHTDRAQYAGKGYTNWNLSTERALAFQKEIVTSGIPDNRTKGVRGYADTKLKFPAKPFAPGNRRVTLLLPWGKKAAKPNSAHIEQSITRQSVGPDGGQKFNILAPNPKPPHL